MKLLSRNLFEFEKEPVENFSALLDLAQAQGLHEPTAMTLSTQRDGGGVDSRIVLFKGLSQGAFCFFTNYNSPKSQQLEKYPQASLLFYWPELATQVRIRGEVVRLSRKESEDYFATRPRLSQLGAWASKQSTKIKSYEELENFLKLTEEKFLNQAIPCPEHWGGFGLKPNYFEFWFGVEGRLHYRYSYQLTAAGWDRSMLSP